MELKKFILFEAQFKAYSLSILCISNACQIPLKELTHLLKVSILRVFHLVIPCYCLAWKTLYLVDREKGDFCERLSTHMYFNIVSVRAGCRYTTVISSLVLPPTPPIHSYYGITFYLYSFLFFCCCFIVPSHHLQQMLESSDEEYMISPKVSKHANWSSIPSRRSARIQSINRKQEKSNNIWKDSEADSGDPSSSNILLFLFIWFWFYTICCSIINVIVTFVMFPFGSEHLS